MAQAGEVDEEVAGQSLPCGEVAEQSWRVVSKER